MRSALAMSLLGLGLMLAACGESSEERAKDDVCDARADVDKNEGIRDGLAKMVDAQGDLSDKERQQVERANQDFKSQLQKLAQDAGPNRLRIGNRSQRG